LIELLVLAPLFYGSPTENDMSWAEYGVLFRSIHLEGMARPEGGIKALLDLLIERFEQEGGELRMRTGVAEILHNGGKVRGVRLDDGTELECERVLSSAGLVETETLCGRPRADGDDPRIGRLSFVETCCVLDTAPAALGHEDTIVFYSDSERFLYEKPSKPVEPRAGVITCPSNYHTSQAPTEHFVRVTCPANYEHWTGLAETDYASEKERAVEAMLACAETFSFAIRPHTVFRDSFTPRTIERYTGHRGGAVYGSPRKARDGRTELAGLELIGTDQGLVGVVGALLSGITIANRSLLEPAGGTT
jgi:phytoene dehydrogenase-like protein